MDETQEQAKREFEELVGAPTGGATTERGLIPHFNYLAALEFAKYLQEELPEAFEKFKAIFA